MGFTGLWKIPKHHQIEGQVGDVEKTVDAYLKTLTESELRASLFIFSSASFFPSQTERQSDNLGLAAQSLLSAGYVHSNATFF